MHFVCDVHISFKVKNILIQNGHAAVHLNEILNGDVTADDVIADFCEKSGCILITKDYDFVDSFYLKKSPPKIIKINLGNISNMVLLERIKALLPLLDRLAAKDNFLVEVDKDNFFISEE